VDPVDDGDLERQLEDAASPDEAAVERIVTAALGARPSRRLTAGRIAAFLGAAALVAATIVLNWPATPDSPEPIRMRNVGDVIVVDYPDGSRSIIGPARPDRELFAGFNYVMVEGERQ
jgi:hypothetical protein